MNQGTDPRSVVDYTPFCDPMLDPEVKERPKNILDHFKQMSEDDIRYSLEQNRNNFTVFIDNRTKNLNAGTLVRLSHINLCKKIVFYGRRSYNRVPAVYAYKWENIEVCHDMNELRDYISANSIERVVGFDNNINRKTQYLHNYQWDKNIHTMMCFGSEGEGMAEEVLDICDDIVEAKQLGVIRSHNVSNMGAMAMYDYLVKTGKFD